MAPLIRQLGSGRDHGWWRGVGGLVVITVVSALILTSKRTVHADPLRTPFAGATSNCSHTCRECGINLHDIIAGGGFTSSELESCGVGYCASHSCDAIESGLGDLLPAVYLADGRGLKQLLQEYPETLSWNEERQSVQVTCSEGFTIANIPLSPDQVRRLTE